MRIWKRLKNQGKDDQERIDNFVLVVGLYDWDPCILIANFFIITLLSGLLRISELRL